MIMSKTTQYVHKKCVQNVYKIWGMKNICVGVLQPNVQFMELAIKYMLHGVALPDNLALCD